MRMEVIETESTAINGDCMDVMRQYPDKYFDLAVVDTNRITRTGGKWAEKYAKKS